MSSESYASYWDNPKFNDAFIGHKRFTVDYELFVAKWFAKEIKDRLFSYEIDVFEVGAGHGFVSAKVLEELSEVKKIVGYDGIDISEYLINLSRENIVQLVPFTESVNLAVADGSTFKPEKKYDLVFSFNAWYGIPEKSIEHYIEALKPGGIFAILLNRSDNITVKITNDLVEPIKSSETISNWLEKNNIRHEVLQISDPLLSKEQFLDGGKLKPEAETFFRYFLRRLEGSLDDIPEYLESLDPVAFTFPQELILIRNSDEK